MAVPAYVPPAPIRPRSVWYWIGGLLIVAGIVGGIALMVAGVVSVSRTVDDFARFRVPPGELPEGGVRQELTFDRSGTYTIYYEWDSEIDGLGVDSPEDIPPDIRFVLIGADGVELPLQDAGTTASFSVSGRAGESIGKVTVPSAGTYVAEVESASASEPYVIAVGKGVLARLAAYVGGGIAVGFIGVAAGIVAIVVTAVKRSRRKREQQRAALAAAQTAGTTPWYGTPTPSPYGAPAPYGTPPPAGPGGSPGPWAPPPPPPG
jgi:hypothetical protein